MKNIPKGFLPYALAALAIGLVGGFSTVLGPAFVAELGIPYANTTWTALAQAMSTAAWAPILGKLGDVLGKKRTLLAGLFVFTLGNALSALAGSLEFMLLARFVVGLGTAAMAPVILGYILTEFPKDQVSRGFSLYMLLSSGAVVIGPMAGSALLAGAGWRGMLWLCTGISGAVLLLCLLPGGETAKNPTDRRFDWWGGGFVVAFFSTLLCLPALGQNLGFGSGAFWGALALAAVTLAGLVITQRRAEVPILPGKLLKSRGFFLSVAALFLTQGLMQANMTNAMVYLRYTHPGRELASGLSVSVMYLGMSLGAAILGPMADRVPPKRVLTGSLVLTALGCGSLLPVGHTSPAWVLMVPLGLLGLGLGGNGTVFLKIALADIPPEQAGAASGTFGLFRDLAAPFGVAVLVPLFTNRVTAAMAAGQTQAVAAPDALHLLAVVELLCVAAAMVAVAMMRENS